MVSYALRYGADHAVEALKRHRARLKSRWLRWPVKALCAAGLLTLAALSVYAKLAWLVFLFLFFLALLIGAPYLDFAHLRTRYRKHAELNVDAKVEISHDQLRFHSSNYNSEVQWPAFQRAIEFRDGILLYRAPWDFHWLPDASIASGTAAEARAIIRDRVAQYDVL